MLPTSERSTAARSNITPPAASGVPSYGQISAYWSIEDELEDQPYYRFRFEENELSISPQCILFYPSGKIRSITLWPGYRTEIMTPLGKITTDLGVELYENGHIRSIEPIYGTVIDTPFGEMKPYVYRDLMLHAENSSMVFAEDGKLMSVSTILSVLEVNGTELRSPGYKSPLKLDLGGAAITAETGSKIIRIDAKRDSVRFR